MDEKSFKGNFLSNVIYKNPILVQILGICSTLAVTNSLSNTMVMTVAVLLVTGFSNFVISLIRNLIPSKVRMVIQTLVIAFLVIVVDIYLKGFKPEVSKALGPYVGLIITNCIIMGRAEAFAQANGPFISFWDGITAGFGYMVVLVAIAFVRELLGFGTLFGLPVISQFSWFTPWTIMITAPSAFFLLAIAMWIANSFKKEEGGAK